MERNELTTAQTLAKFAVNLPYECIPDEVVERGKDCATAQIIKGGQ